jgi:hypothetical protein
MQYIRMSKVAVSVPQSTRGGIMITYNNAALEECRVMSLLLK